MNLIVVVFPSGYFDRNKISFLVIHVMQVPRNEIIHKKTSTDVLFHQSKDSRLKDQNKNKFHFISVAMKTVVSRNFSRRNKLSFRVSSKHPLSQSFYNHKERSQKSVLIYTSFLSNQGQAPAFKVTFIFKIFRIQSYLKIP